MIITSDLATQLQVNNHAMSLQMISNNNNGNFILLSFMMSMYLLTVVYYLILLTEWFINKLQAKRSYTYNINIVDDNSPQQDTNTNNNNSVNTQQIITNSSESSQEQLINNSECTTIPSESSSENHHHEEQQENTINNQTEADAYIHPDLSPSSASSTSDSIFTATKQPAAETVQAESLLTIFKELVQRVIDIEKEWTRIISSQLENSSRLVYYDSSDSSLCSSATTSSSSSSSDEYCHVSGRSSFQNVRMRRTTQSSNMKRMNSFQFPRGINFAL